MTLSSKIHEIRRCRPLLGTFVEITIQGEDLEELESAVSSGFDTIEDIQTLMSAHDPDSELSRLNREAFQHPVKLSDTTFDVIQRGLQLAQESHGAFDFTIGALLARWGYLPKNLSLRRGNHSNWRSVQLLSRNRVHFLCPLTVDLGGIAKGYAVDCAVNVLRQYKVDAGIVNAGGDLRAFGPKAIPVHLRHPSNSQPIINPIRLCNAALATSAPSFTRRQSCTQVVSHLINPNTNIPITHSISVSVQASECWLADGLTKIVLNMKDQAKYILAKYGAEAFVILA